MDGIDQDRLEKELTATEFPGEDPEWIPEYLESRQFVERVMKAIAVAHVRASRSTIWALVGLLNLAILVVTAMNPHLVQDVLTLEHELVTFFYLFLAATLAGCLIGLLFSLDGKRVERSLQHIQNLYRELFRHNGG